MAWRCTGKTNIDLITNMTANRIVSTDRVAAAFKRVDRANYVLDKRDAYVDSPQSINYGATISAPHMHAHATSNLFPFLKPGARVLDVGSGSGYTCAVFHNLVSPSVAESESAAGTELNGQPEPRCGKVIGVDHIPQLVEWAVRNLRNDGLQGALDKGEIEMVVGDGREGYPAEAPYDAIHVGAAPPSIPQALIDQLASPGRMFIPVGGNSQEIVQLDKDEDGNVTQKKLFAVMYVPLTDAKDQLDGW